MQQMKKKKGQGVFLSGYEGIDIHFKKGIRRFRFVRGEA